MAPTYERAQPEYIKVKQPGKCRVIAIPVPPPKEYPAIGLVGEVAFTSSHNGVCLDIMGKKFVLPFCCVQEIDDSPITDEELVAVMLENPYGVYKILRGLWRMTKHDTIRNFMERGEIPPGPAMVQRNNKSSADYNKQWDQAEEAARMDDEAALSGAFTGEFVC